MLGCKPTGTPINQNHQLGAITEGILVEKGRYQKLVGRYQTKYSICRQHGKSVYALPLKSHIDAVLRILRYLKSTPGEGLLFSKNNHLRVKAYTDANWAGSITVRRPTSRYCTFVGHNLVIWRRKSNMQVFGLVLKQSFEPWPLAFVNSCG